MNLKVRNWDKWQSYRKDRGQPPWIKIHRSLMRDENWVALSDAQRGQLVAIWMLAADRDGVIPASPAVIRKLCFMDSEPDLNLFINQGFLEGRRQPDATATPTRRQPDAPEENREEKNREEKTIAPKNGAVVSVEPQKPKELTPIQRVVRAWKIQNGNEPDDAAWDKVHFAANSGHAKRLLELFGGDADAAIDCIEDRWGQIVTKQGLSLSLAGVVKASDVFRQRWLENKSRREGALN